MKTTRASYEQALRAMSRAACEWQQRNPDACVLLNTAPPGFPPLPSGKKVALIGTLHESIEWLGANEETRELLRELDRASGDQATILMAQAAVWSVFGEAN